MGSQRSLRGMHSDGAAGEGGLGVGATGEGVGIGTTGVGMMGGSGVGIES